VHRVKQSIVTLDLEGVLVPEIWIAVADKTGIKELRLTTRDVPDYDVLMKGRLNILDQHNLKLADIQEVIGTLRPLEGAKAFLDELRTATQVIILSDTFEEFAKPLMRQLDWPTLLCHRLEVTDGRITNYKLRIAEQKKQAVAALKTLNYYVIAAEIPLMMSRCWPRRSRLPVPSAGEYQTAVSAVQRRCKLCGVARRPPGRTVKFELTRSLTPESRG
jgi:phosphoserine/homoserine phosphotransferase